MTLKKEHVSTMRLHNQRISHKAFKKPEEVVSWMGAMQAQDYEMSKWAIGLRMAKASHDLVERALHEGQIIRTHVLRPTWHLVAAEDLPWMLELTAPHVQRTALYSHKQLGLDANILKKSYKIIEKALAIHQHLSREELAGVLQEANMDVSENRISHYLFAAELEGLICSGPRKGKQLSYALLEERVPKILKLTRDEALATLAQRYFTSHGPATLKDFVWWSGLSLTDAKKGIQAIGGHLQQQEVDGIAFWFHSQQEPMKNANNVHILPAYDEFIISYADRSATLAIEFGKHAISNNGIFKPIIVVDGQVVGIWKRLSKPKQVQISLRFFKSPDAKMLELTKNEFEPYGRFLNKELIFEL